VTQVTKVGSQVKSWKWNQVTFKSCSWVKSQFQSEVTLRSIAGWLLIEILEVPVPPWKFVFV